MTPNIGAARLVEALARARDQAELRRTAEQVTSAKPRRMAFTIAISRETGAGGAALARAVGARLGWPVYDRELVHLLANDLGVRPGLLDWHDERRVSWIRECIEAFSAEKGITQTQFVHHLVKAVLSLAAQGECVILGRGATRILPRDSTLRVRLIAPLDYRIDNFHREYKVARDEAKRLIERIDGERRAFAREHFMVDLDSPTNYDIVLDTSRFGIDACTAIVVEALRHMEQRAGVTGAAKLPSVATGR